MSSEADYPARSEPSDQRDSTSQPYNYAIFRGDAEDWEAFTGHPHVGERAPDATLAGLDGASVRLADLWRETHLLLEFGSYT